MYTPSSFVENDLSILHSCIEQNSFATLITTEPSGPAASHLPLLLDRSAGPNGTLIGHMARANPQWKNLAGKEALAIFQGPHAYISPAWLQERNVVPTWNYVAVHVSGNVQIVEEPTALLDIVRRYVEFYESPMPEPWQLDSTEPDFTASLLNAIVGFTIEVASLEGKWKLSQNHNEGRRQRVIKGLKTRSDENSTRIAELMQATLLPDSQTPLA